VSARARVLAAITLALVVLAAPHVALTADWNLSRLMQGLAQQKGGRVNFTEKKYIALLDRPVESSGELIYVPPSRLERRTLTPSVESVVLDRDVMVVERGKQRYTLQLQQYPEMTAIVDSIRKTLAGDLVALERQYRVDLQGTPERWVLTLLPSDARIAGIVQRIEISGVRDELRQIEMRLADGDRSVMSLQRAAPP
jgi:outer membrane lipoprotein-sorting protein